MLSAEAQLRPHQAIAVGVSAGAIDALSIVLPAIPSNYPGPVFVVVHLPPTSASMLPGLFGPLCQLVVREPEDKEPIAPGTIYFAPPDYHLMVGTDGRIALSNDEPVHFSRPAADVLFETAAAVYGPGLLGIVLTGASGDGAHGARAIRRAGGQLIVQDPSESLASVMPASAIAATRPDAVLPLRGIAAILASRTLDVGVSRVP